MKLSNVQLDFIKETLQKHLAPEYYSFFIFGSYANNTSRKSSDLDILICGKNPVPLEKLAFAKESFEESNLPFRIDLLDEKRASQDFINKIRKNLKEL